MAASWRRGARTAPHASGKCCTAREAPPGNAELATAAGVERPLQLLAKMCGHPQAAKAAAVDRRSLVSPATALSEPASAQMPTSSCVAPSSVGPTLSCYFCPQPGTSCAWLICNERFHCHIHYCVFAWWIYLPPQQHVQVCDIAVYDFDGQAGGVADSGEGGTAAAAGTPFPAGCSGRTCRLVHRRTLRGHMGPIPFVAWSPDDSLLATCSELPSHGSLILNIVMSNPEL